MNSSRKTIFNLERRRDLVSDFRFTVVDMEKTTVITKSRGELSLKQLLNASSCEVNTNDIADESAEELLIKCL